MSSSLSAANRSREEVEAAIRAFSPADWARLRKVASYYSRREIEAKDLLQEALTRALDGRNCPTRVDVVKFLAEAMRSIADGEGEKVEHRLVLVSIAHECAQRDEALSYRDPSQSAEAAMISEAEEAQIRKDILALFDDDPVARDIVEGTMEGMTAEELRQLTGLDKTAYDSKRKLIRRRIDKKYPEGWKS